MKSFMGKTLGIILSVVMMVSLVPGMAVLAATDGEGTGSEEVGEVTISEEAQKVVDMFEALPDFDTYTFDDYDQFEPAFNAFYELEEADKLAVANSLGYDDINAFSKTFYDRRNFLLEDAAKYVEDLIDAIPENVTLNDMDLVAEARSTFEKYGKFGLISVVSNYDKLVAAEAKLVSAMIKALPDPDNVTMSDLVDVQNAWIAYFDLSEEQMSQINQELVDKLFEDTYVLDVLILKDDIDLAKKFIENYRDLMTDEEYDALAAAIKEGEEVLSSESPSDKDVVHATNIITDATMAANETVGLHFTVIDDNGYIWLVDSKTGLMFEISQLGLWDAAFDLFVDAGCPAYVDEVAIPADGMKYEPGSVIITLMPEYLKTLSTGEHKLTVKFDNGGSIDIMFTIKNASDVPATGETISPVVYVGSAMILAAAAAFVVNKKLAKKES